MRTGELLIIPQSTLRIFTEMGRMHSGAGLDWDRPPQPSLPGSRLTESAAVAENHGALLRLPELGPLGSNEQRRP